MSKNIKFFFIAFLINLPFWWGVNIFEKYLEDILFSQFYQPPAQFFLAQISSIQNPEKEIPEIAAASALSIKIYKNGNQKIIFEKNPNQIWPIASLTKLMTALIAIENYDLSQKLQVSKKAIEQPEDSGQLKVGEELSVENLLYLSLIESSNDSAFALTGLIGEEGFVDLMNLEAKYLGLRSTHFTDPTGYSVESYSTAKDLVLLTNHLIEKRPMIWEISAFSEFDLFTPDGIFHHRLLNTNQLLTEYQEIIGGKTGYTTKAGYCLLLVLENPEDNSIFINVILGSVNRFEEMRKLINYAL